MWILAPVQPMRMSMRSGGRRGRRSARLRLGRGLAARERQARRAGAADSNVTTSKVWANGSTAQAGGAAAGTYDGTLVKHGTSRAREK